MREFIKESIYTEGSCFLTSQRQYLKFEEHIKIQEITLSKQLRLEIFILEQIAIFNS
jgi:hypothetical protein